MKTNQLARSAETFHELHDCRAIDGDTIQAKISLGFGTWLERRFRLRHFFAPELHGANPPSGIVAKDRLQEALDNNTCSFPARGSREDRFGRLLIVLYLGGTPADPHTVLGCLQLTEEQHTEDLATQKRNLSRKGGVL